MKSLSIVIIGFVLIDSLSSCNPKPVSLQDAARHAVAQSKLTALGNPPFHLKARIVETTNLESDYNAEIEEFWVSPDKWRRTISSPGFSQLLIVNGSQAYEQDKGDYFPWWLNDLVTAIFDPLPMLDSLSELNASMDRPSGSEVSCARSEKKVGTPPAENSVFLVFCFEGSPGLLESVVTPEYEADFKGYSYFKNHQIADRFVIDPEPGTTIEARIVQLDELKSPDESIFAIQHSTPATERLGRIVVSDATARSLSASTLDILWPTVRSGKTSGVLSMHISVDRSGHVREAWPLNSDNAGLDDPAREQVMKWQFKPAKAHDIPVQMETVLTFAFNTKIGDPIPILSDAEARKLAAEVVEPVFPPGSPKGAEVKVEIGVGLDGKVNGVGNLYHVPTPLFMAASEAVEQWRFRPYVRNGKPDLFSADIIFHVP